MPNTLDQPAVSLADDARAAMTHSPQRNRRTVLILSALLALLMAALYLRTARFAFVNFDDGQYIYGNPRLNAGLSWAGIRWAMTSRYFFNWHPLTWLAYLGTASFFGTKPGPFHVLNFSLHALNAGLLCYTLWRMTGSWWGAAVAAAIYALHPLRVESVAWISETKDVLSGLFSILAILAYTRYSERPTWQRHLAVTFALAAGLASKPSVVTLPAAMLLLDYWPLNRLTGTWKTTGLLVLEKIPWFAMALAASAITYGAQRVGGAVSMDTIIPLKSRLANAAISTCTYLCKTFCPTHLAFFYPHPYAIGLPPPIWMITGATVVLAIITTIAVVCRRSMPYLIVGWLWFLGMLVPMSGIVQAGEQALADRYTYLPSIGLTIAIVWCCARIVRSRTILTVLAATAVTALLIVSWQQIGYWRDSLALFGHADRVIPNNYTAKADFVVAQVQIDAANNVPTPPQMVQLARDAIAINPTHPLPHYALAKALEQLQDPARYNDALREYRYVIQREPEQAPFRDDAGGLLDKLNRTADAILLYSKAVQLDPLYADAHNNLANDLAAMGRIDEAVPHWQQALALDPRIGSAHGWLATALQRRGDRAGAIRHFRAALEAGEHRPQWMADLAWLLATDARCSNDDAELALRVAAEACNLQRDQPLLLDTLAAAQARAGRFDDAVATANHAADLAAAARQPALAKIIQSRMMLYRAGHAVDSVK